ncbi:MAG: hypothetical protein HOQ34_14010 [Gemmatimonadaceae bacterium]|nr:hypothetical protein [Gemmatimonadaceae bacterium]
MRSSRSFAFALALLLLPATASAQPRPGQLPPKPPVLPRTPIGGHEVLPAGTAPGTPSITAEGGWAAVIDYVPAPWATGHVLLRATSANGPFNEIARDTTPGPELARKLDMEARGIVMARPGMLAPISPRGAATAPSSGSAPAVRRYSLRDRYGVPEAQLYYRVQALYKDSSAAASSVATLKFPSAIVPGLTASVSGSQTVLMWDTLSIRPIGYMFYADGQQISPSDVFNFSGGKKMVYVNAPADRPVRYEVRAWYDAGGKARGFVTAEPTPVVGFADYHTHQFASVGFGGAPLPLLLRDQISEDQLRAAYAAGLRLMVVLAVNTQRPCEILRDAALAEAIDAVAGTNIRPTMSCDDSSNVERQLAAARAFEARVEAEDAAPGSGFYRIVTTPAEARAAIRQGKLAVVLGIEVDNVFGCGTGMGRSTACSVAQMTQRMDRYRALGVRQVNLVHLADNGFGGMALYDDKLVFNSWGMNGVLPAMRDCSPSGVFWRFGPAVASDDVLQKAKELAELTGAFSAPVAGELIKGYVNGIPKSSAMGMCNSLGLTALGERALAELMNRKMIIDIDHMSQLAVGRALQLTAQRGYPVIASHSGLLEASLANHAAEGQRSATQIDSLRKMGGALAIIAHQGNANETPGFPGSVSSNCDGSTKEWAQVYQWAVNRLGGPTVAAVGIGSDFNGIDNTVVPRFGDNACDGNATQKAQQTNPTNTEFDTKGLANIGLYGAFIQDLKNVGLTEAQLAPLMRSAESYIQAWERAESAGMQP